MAIASFVVLPNLLSDVRDSAGNLVFNTLDASEKAAIRTHDLAVIRDPYVAIGLVVLVMFVIIALVRMPRTDQRGEKVDAGATLRHLWHNHPYRWGVLTQMFYVAAQIMVWTFIIQYAGNLGINKATAQLYNIVAMSLALSFRFVGTYMMKYVSSGSVAVGVRRMCRLVYVGNHPDRGYGRALLPRGYQRVYVDNVSEHLRHCIGEGR